MQEKNLMNISRHRKIDTVRGYVMRAVMFSAPSFMGKSAQKANDEMAALATELTR